MSACPGLCNAGFRDAAAAYEDAAAAWHDATLDWLEKRVGPAPQRPDPPDVQPVPGDPVFCGRCKAWVRLRLKEIDELASTVQAQIDGHRSVPLDRERVSGTGGTPSPEPRVDAIDVALTTLEQWERDYRKWAGFDAPPPRGRYFNRLTGCVDWLTSRVDAILAHPEAGPRFASTVVDQHKNLMRAAHADHGERTLPKPCPQCDLKTMKVRSGDDYAKCENCGLIRAVEDYERRTQ